MTEDLVETIRELASLGHNKTVIARFVGVDRETVYSLCKKHDIVVKGKAIGQTSVMYQVERFIKKPLYKRKVVLWTSQPRKSDKVLHKTDGVKNKRRSDCRSTKNKLALRIGVIREPGKAAVGPVKSRILFPSTLDQKGRNLSDWKCTFCNRMNNTYNKCFFCSKNKADALERDIQIVINTVAAQGYNREGLTANKIVIRSGLHDKRCATIILETERRGIIESITRSGTKLKVWRLTKT